MEMSDYIINDHGEKRPPTKEEELRQIITDLEAKLQEAEKMVGNLKCCGNCKKRFTYNCPKPADEHLEGTGKHRFDNRPNFKCDAWQSDNKTQEARKC
jgi:hypothetical protein